MYYNSYQPLAISDQENQLTADGLSLTAQNLVLRYNQLNEEYWQCPVGSVDLWAELENLRLLIKKTMRENTVLVPVPKYLKNFISRMYGAEPVNILSITTEQDYRKFKFTAEKINSEDITERLDRSAILIAYPQTMADLFDQEYCYQAEHFFFKNFNDELIKHIILQLRTGVPNARSSIIDFFQMYGISQKDLSIDACRKKWERYVKKNRVNQPISR